VHEVDDDEEDDDVCDLVAGDGVVGQYADGSVTVALAMVPRTSLVLERL